MLTTIIKLPVAKIKGQKWTHWS